MRRALLLDRAEPVLRAKFGDQVDGVIERSLSAEAGGRLARQLAPGKGQKAAAEASKAAYAAKLAEAGYGAITTEIVETPEFFYAEDYHQQYLHKNPGGYCNHGPNGLTCPVGLLSGDSTPAQQDVLPPRV